MRLNCSTWSYAGLFPIKRERIYEQLIGIGVMGIFLPNNAMQWLVIKFYIQLQFDGIYMAYIKYSSKIQLKLNPIAASLNCFLANEGGQ